MNSLKMAFLYTEFVICVLAIFFARAPSAIYRKLDHLSEANQMASLPNCHVTYD